MATEDDDERCLRIEETLARADRAGLVERNARIEVWIEQSNERRRDLQTRLKMKTQLEPLIPGVSVHLGGTTSVDVTQPGIDKAYGIAKLRDTLGIGIDQMLFVGDALFPGGNDYPAKQAGVVSVQVRDANETKRVIETIIACLGDGRAVDPPVNPS